MARKKRNEQYNGVKDGSFGYSQKSLDALESGQYGQLTGRKAKYNSSREQKNQANELPVLEGMGGPSKEIWESRLSKNRKVDTDSARRNYEQSIGHNAPDYRDLRRNGYGSSYSDIDFSGLSKFDREYLDAALEGRNNKHVPMSDNERIAEAQSFIDKYGKSKNEVLDAYQIYKDSEERRKREESPFLTGFKDFRSAPDRGLANAVKYLGQNYVPDSDIEKFGDWLREKTGAEEVEKQRNYSRESDKIGNVKKALLDPYFQYGDLASSELAAALLGGGAMGDPATGFGMMFEGNPLLKAAMKYGGGYGLTADEKYNQLVKQGVDEKEAAQMANVSGLSMAAAQAVGKLIPSLGAEVPLAQRLLTNGGINSTIMAGRQGAEEIADMLIRGNEADYNQSVQKHIAEGMTPEKADTTAKIEILSRLGGAGLFGFLTGAGSELASNGLSKALSKGVDNIDDTLNSVWANQPALEDKGVPMLTGTVDNTQALTGSQYNVPALVDNIYPIQMPGTQGVIQMPGTNGVILPTIEGPSTPAVNNAVNKVANESTGWVSPRLIKKLEGADLENAKATVATNEKTINSLKTEIETLKKDKTNYYRGNLKKAIEKTITNREKQITALEKTNKDLNQQMQGGLKPMLDMLTPKQKNAIYDTTGKTPDSVFSQINFMAKFAGDTPEAKKLAKTAQNAIRDFVKTGSSKSVKQMTDALTELDNMAKSTNATWTSSKGNEWNYESRFGEQAQPLSKLQPVADIYNAERAAAKAAQPTGTSAPRLTDEEIYREGVNLEQEEANEYMRQNHIEPMQEASREVSEPPYDPALDEEMWENYLNPMIEEWNRDAADYLDEVANPVPEADLDAAVAEAMGASAPIKQPQTYLNEEKNIYQLPDNIKEIAQNNKVEVTKMSPVASVKTGMFKEGEGRLPQKVGEYWAKWGNKAHNEVLGDVTLSKRNVKDSISHNALTRRKVDTFAVVPDVIEKGKVIDYQPSWKGRDYDTAVIVAPVTIENASGVPEEYITGVIVRRNKDMQKFYTHDAVSVKINEPSLETREASDTPSEGEGSLSVYNILRNIADSKREYNYSQYKPNFTTVGDSYVPQEVPNVQPTPPTTPPPTQEVPNMEHGDKTSQYYKNTMRNTEGNRNMTDEEYADRFNEDLYQYFSTTDAESVNRGRDFIKNSGGTLEAAERLLSPEFDSEEKFSGYHLDAVHILTNDLEQRAKELEAQGIDATDLWRRANKLHKKAQEWDTYFAQGLQANQKWKKATPQGAFDNLISEINRGVDKKKTTGYTRDVNKLADQIADAVENSENKESLIAKIKDIFAKNRDKNAYNTTKAEQQVLDLVGGDKNTKMSITDLADEAGKLIRQEMGVSSLTPKEERAVLNLLDAASKLEPGTRPYNELVSQAMVIVDESLPSSAGEKFKSLLYDNMLASIKTMFTRNFGGNVVGNAIDAMAAPFQVGADALVGKITGERTRTLTGKSIVEAAKGLGHGFKDWGLDIGYSLKNKTAFNTPRSGQESLEDVLRAVHKTWKTQSENKGVKAIHNALSAYDYIIRKGMEGGDRPIYEAQYAATRAELYHLVDKYGDAGLRKGLPTDKRDLDTDDLIEAMAINEALEAVLQNDSSMKQAAKHLKAFFKKSSEDMLGIDIASMSHAPFVEVPANMASNFFKLTPIGWAGNIARTIGEKKKYGSINQRRFTGELGLNVLGGLMGAGLFAAANKYISDKGSDDKEERKLQQNNGYQEFALQTPNESTQVDISDVPYLGPMVKYAKMERDAYNEGKKEGGTWGGIKGALGEIPTAASAATVDTLYQALNRLTGADFQYGGDSNLINNAINNIKSSAGSMGVPSWVRQTAQYLDPYKRDLGDYGTSEYNKNLIINGIPILREKMLSPKIDTAGQPVPELGGSTGLRRALSAYVSPWKVSHPHANTSAVQEYANMLKLATNGEINPQMKVISKSDLTDIKGYDKENYSHEDLRKLQEAYYTSNTELGNALINDPWFTNLSYEKQGELLDELWNANKALVKENFVREGLTPEQIEAKGDELYTTDNKLAGIIRDDDENHTGLLKWLKDETGRDEMNKKYGTEMSHDKYVEYNDREEGYAEQRASEADKAKALGMNVTDYEKYEAEYPGGAQAYYDDKEAAKQYGFVKSDKTANVDAYNIAKQLGNGDPTVIEAYSDYKQEGIRSNAYGAKAEYLVDEDRLTDEQKGMIIAGSQDGTKLGSIANGAKGAYKAGGNDYAGVYYYYLLKNLADTDGSGTVTKKEREAFIANDNPYLDQLWQLNQDMYNYIAANLK